jgi:C4-type Zn-finger protein
LGKFAVASSSIAAVMALVGGIAAAFMHCSACGYKMREVNAQV